MNPTSAPLARPLIIAVLAICAGLTSTNGWSKDVGEFAEEGVQRLSKYLQIDTVNPPGNETRGVEFLAAILDDAGIDYETAESAPGRGNLWAKLEASGGEKEPGLVLLHHIDVVPANRKYWSFEPLSGDVKNGFVYGRGAIDTKGLGIAQLQAFLALHASGKPLNRDVWLIATADEEAGGFFGAGWLIENRRELFDGVGYVLNEGGSARAFGDTTAVLVEVTQKVPLWLRVTSRGTPGHGSAPRVETSVTKMVRALKRISETEFPVRVLQPVADMFEGIAPFQTGEDKEVFASIGHTHPSNDYLTGLKLRNPGAHALLRNTCSITRLEGSSKINVIPAEVHAELDCRLLPDQNPEAFLAELQTIINDGDISIDKIMGFTPAVSKTETPLYKAIQKVSRNYFDAEVIPTVSGGFTDSHFFRDIGVTSYGYSPFAFTVAEFSGVHGNDERVSVSNIVNGVKIYYELLEEFAAR
ncbi:MAG: M20/M25/M40 family metallo-hydrolase [Pseudomonadales bacterium]|nr:M20/M25/M40 family metallo-hydrolase [Pseudomonadales bacterium]